MEKEKKLKKIKIEKEKVLKNGSKTLLEFKEFISRGNVIDMAVGTIIGAAFGKIVTSIVNDILMPLIGIVIGGIDFTNLTLNVGGAVVSYGMFLQNVIDFLIVAACIFIFVKFLNSFKKKEEAKEVVPTIDEKTELLKEIRDLLKEEKNTSN